MRSFGHTKGVDAIRIFQVFQGTDSTMRRRPISCAAGGPPSLIDGRGGCRARIAPDSLGPQRWSRVRFQRSAWTRRVHCGRESPRTGQFCTGIPRPRNGDDGEPAEFLPFPSRTRKYRDRPRILMNNSSVTDTLRRSLNAKSPQRDRQGGEGWHHRKYLQNEGWIARSSDTRVSHLGKGQTRCQALYITPIDSRRRIDTQTPSSPPCARVPAAFPRWKTSGLPRRMRVGCPNIGAVGSAAMRFR
jgi:hypothetical protein